MTEATQLQRMDLTFRTGIRSNAFLEEGLDICGIWPIVIFVKIVLTTFGDLNLLNLAV